MKLKTTYLQLYLIFLSTPLLAQYVVTINATVSDKQTRQLIPYVNISFAGKNIKAISDKQGHFMLSYDEDLIGKNDTITFSALGYRKEKVNVTRFYKLLKNTTKIYLYPKDYQPVTTVTNIQKGNIYGRVTSDTIPLQGATVQVKNTFVETQTDNQGRYRIKAQRGAILLVSFLGMKTKEVLVTDANKLDIRLKTDAELLNTVVLKGKVEKEEKIDLGFGIKTGFDAIGTSVDMLTSKDISPQYYDFADLLRGRFSGIRVTSKPGSSMPVVWIRGGKQSFFFPSPAIYDIDGIISIKAPYVNPQQIETVVILKSLAATNKYGSLGGGGVVIIRTKGFVGIKAPEPKKTTLIKGNDYTEDLPLLSNRLKKPSSIQALEMAGSYKEALSIYKKLTVGADLLGVPFYLNTSDYFRRWDTGFSDKILAGITQNL